jgi:hypothetical protein
MKLEEAIPSLFIYHVDFWLVFSSSYSTFFLTVVMQLHVLASIGFTGKRPQEKVRIAQNSEIPST